jgi:hypothetical protein
MKMIKRVVIAVITVFVTWSVLDFVIHGLILDTAYQTTAALWRPMGEMKMGLIYITVLVSSIVFVSIYARFFAEKGISTGLIYGILFGVGAGISMGYGTYAVMPIPYKMAFVWFLGTVVEGTLGGVLVGLIVRK